MVTVTWMDDEEESFLYHREVPGEAGGSVVIEDVTGEIVNIPKRNVRYFSFSNNPGFES